MQISNLVSQYQRNTSSNSTDELKGASSMQKLVSSVGELEAGSVFEGTVSSVRGGKVTLALSTGQQIVAQLDGKVRLTIGLPMFFQVKSNEGGIMAIRPYNGNGTGGNPILLNALTSAGVPVTERNLEMVNAMMQRQMPINKQSILDMIKVVSTYENTSVQTLVDMTRLGLPVDGELAAQFEKYQQNDYAIVGKMDTVLEQVVDLLGSEELSPGQAVDINQKLFDMAVRPDFTSQAAIDDVEQFLLGKSDAKQEGVTLELHLTPQNTAETVPFANQVLKDVFSEEQLMNLTKLLQSTPSLVENPELFVTESGEEIFVDTLSEEGSFPDKMQESIGQTAGKQTLNSELTVEEFLKSVQDNLTNKQEFGFLGVQKLFSSREYRFLLKNVMQEQWLLKPEELKSEKVSETYERLIRQLDQMEQLVKATGTDQSKLLETTADIRSNVEFMNQINQVYTYVQLPLKLTGQQANGDLYVYTNKKNLNDPDGELSAFLHLDLENLGSTDVPVKMQKKHVKTNFYFSDDGSYDLIQKHLPLLEARLNKKGYTCTFTVSNEDKKVDFVNDFLRKDLPSAGTLHRYSFDVRT